MRTVVLVHGTAEVPASWSAAISKLGPGWETIALRRPEDMERARLPDRYVLAGHSYGGWEALRHTARHRLRVERLVVIEPPAFALLRGWDDEAYEFVRAIASPFTLRAMVDFWHGAGTWDRLPDMRQLTMMAEETRIRRQIARASKLPAPLDVLKALRVPTCVVAGDQTHPVAIRVCERLAELLPEVELRMLEGVGHSSPRTHPELVADAIRG
jgi:pimeloyl-ACP methyl ester carboxylesterase